MSCCRAHTTLRSELPTFARQAAHEGSRNFSAAASTRAPPARAGQQVKAKPLSPFAKKRGVADEDAGGTGGGSGGLGNVLGEVTLPPVDMSHLPEFQPEGVTLAAVGQVQAYTSATMAAFKALTIPKLVQKEFASTPKPSTVIRSATLTVTDLLDKSRATSSNTSRHLLSGPAGSGKSILLLQATSYALSTGWVVLYLPSTTPLIDSSTPHSYSAPHKLFHQPVLAQQLLSRFAGANRAAFKKLQTSRERTFGERRVPLGTSLEELATRNVDEKSSTAVLEALFEELAEQSTVPVLLALDDAQSLFAISSYIDPSYQALEPFALAVPRLLLDFISGSKSFSAGSIILSPSLLSTHSSRAVTEHLASSPAAAGDLNGTILAGLQTLEVPPRLERKEAVGIVRMLQSWRGAREGVSDDSFLEQYVASDGNARQFSRGLERNQQL